MWWWMGILCIFGMVREVGREKERKVKVKGKGNRQAAKLAKGAEGRAGGILAGCPLVGLSEKLG